MKPYPKYLDWLRYACAWFLYFYGITKLTGHQLVTPAWVAQKPIGALSGYLLTWYYFGYSHVYKDLLGVIQVLSATLLLFRKTALLAAMVMMLEGTMKATRHATWGVRCCLLTSELKTAGMMK